jgi:hypothetical protein
METLRIGGGGLAGLACGICLRERGIPVVLHERRRYPLKKVCGEFLSPQGWERCQELGIGPFLTHAPVPLERARFFFDDLRYFDFSLRPGAWGLSREALDSALARRFQALGGELHEESVLEAMDIDARGRPLQSGPKRWMGWKGYLDESARPKVFDSIGLVMLPLEGGYCGLSPIEDGRISVCFVAKAPAQPEQLLRSHPWLRDLASQVRPHAAIAGFDFGAEVAPHRIGDSRRVWPPLVGDGMSRALGAGMALGRGKAAGLWSEPLAHGAAKAAHEFMMQESWRRLWGPWLRLFPALPSAFYRFSRG